MLGVTLYQMIKIVSKRIDSGVSTAYLIMPMLYFNVIVRWKKKMFFIEINDVSILEITRGKYLVSLVYIIGISVLLIKRDCFADL